MIATAVNWYPQQYADLLFAVKAFFGVLAVIMIVFHMSRLDMRSMSLGQRARYFSLLAYAVLVSGASGEQIHDMSLVAYRHLGSLIVTVLLCVSMVISIREQHASGSEAHTGSNRPEEEA